MKQALTIALLIFLLSACSNHDVSKPGYDYIKVFTTRDIDSGNAYNKGLGLWNYLYYNPNSDLAVMRKVKLPSNEPYTFITYVGQFKNQQYTDTIAMLIAFLKKRKEGDLSYEQLIRNNDNYCGSNFSAEYSINGQPYFISFITLGDTLDKFDNFFYNIQDAKWNKEIVSNNRINETEEVVHMLKGLGSYDSLVYTPPYIQPPCEKGIRMELLYGKWRTVGYINRNGKPAYTINIVTKSGDWEIERLRDGELKQQYSGEVVSINKNNTIKVKSKKGTTTLKVLNLTEKCFEYMPEGADSNQIWQLYRMQ